MTLLNMSLKCSKRIIPVLRTISLPMRNISIVHKCNGYPTSSRVLSALDSKHLLTQNKVILQSCIGIIQQRGKSTKKGKSERYNEESSNEYEYDSDSEDEATLHEDDIEMTNSYKDLTVHTQSLRADGILARALNVSRKVIDEAFLASKVRWNDITLPKKSKQVTEDDCLELILKTEAEGEESFKRVRILNISEQKTQKEKFKVKVRAWRGRNTREVENTWRPRTEWTE